MYLRELCELDGVSGNEGAIRSFIKEKITPYCDEIFTDSIGNLIAMKKGTALTLTSSSTTTIPLAGEERAAQESSTGNRLLSHGQRRTKRNRQGRTRSRLRQSTHHLTTRLTKVCWTR